MTPEDQREQDWAILMFSDTLSETPLSIKSNYESSEVSLVGFHLDHDSGRELTQDVTPIWISPATMP